MKKFFFGSLFLLAGMAYLQAQAPAPTTATPKPPTLAYLGCCKCDKGVAQYSQGSLAWRAKTKTFMVIGHTGVDQPIYEQSLPATGEWELDWTKASRAKLVKTYAGTLFAPHRTWPNLTPNNTLDTLHLPINGVFCTSNDDLVALYGPNYINDITGAPFAIVVSDLGAANPVVKGPYKTTNGLNHRLCGYGLELPTVWAHANAPGKMFAWGDPIVSGTANASIGPCLWLTSGFTPNLDLGTTSPIIDFPDATNWAPTPQKDYTPIAGGEKNGGTWSLANTNQFHIPTAEHGWWKTTDAVCGAVWLNDGVLFVGNQGYGYCWYGPGTITINQTALLALGVKDPPAAGLEVKTCYASAKGNWAQFYRPCFWWVSANDLAAVAKGTKKSWEVPLTFIDPNEGVAAVGGIHLNCSHILNGLAYDPTTKTLMACAPKADGNACPLIHAWRVK